MVDSRLRRLEPKNEHVRRRYQFTDAQISKTIGKFSFVFNARNKFVLIVVDICFFSVHVLQPIVWFGRFFLLRKKNSVRRSNVIETVTK